MLSKGTMGWGTWAEELAGKVAVMGGCSVTWPGDVAADFMAMRVEDTQHSVPLPCV